MPESPDPYAPMAALYDLAYGDYIEDIDFYLNLARATGGPILELGTGTGRVAFPLAKAGHRLVGIDASPAMLAKAQEKLKVSRLSRQRLSFVEADMTDFSLDERFALAFVAASTFQHLTATEAQRACIRRAAAHLQPGGPWRLACDRRPPFRGTIRAPIRFCWTGRGATRAPATP